MTEQTSNHGWTIPTVGGDEGQWGTILNNLFDGDLDRQVILEDEFSNRPTADSSSVKLFLATDRRIVYYNDGSSWNAVYGLGSSSNPVPGTSYFNTIDASGSLKVNGTDAALTSRFPLPNSDISNSSVTVAGNPVGLGGSTGVSHGDLDNIGSSDHHEVFEPADYNPEADTHSRYTDSEATSAVGGSTPWANSDLSNDTVTVAGNPVALGETTGISHGDLDDAPASAHHTRYSDSEATSAVGGSTPWVNSDLSNSSVTVAGNAVALGDSTSIAHGDLSSIGSSDHHAKTTSASDLSDVSPDSDSDAHHSRYSDSEATSAIQNTSPTFNNIDVTNRLINTYQSSESGDVREGASGGMISTRVAHYDATIRYGTVLPDTEIYINNSRVVSESSPTTDTFSVNKGDLIDMNKPVAMTYSGNGCSVAPLSWSGTEFVYYISRYEPDDVHIYSPNSVATVENYSNATPGGTPYQTVTVDPGEVATITTESTTGPQRFISDSPVVIVKHPNGGTSNDTFVVPPASREVLHTESNSIYTVNGETVHGNGGAYYYSEDRLSTTQVADGSGTNAEMGQPYNLCGDTYLIPHNISDYEIGAIEPCTVSIDYWDGSEWVNYVTHDLTDASRDNPSIAAEGDNSGSGTDIISNPPILLSSDKPFFIRTNEGSREYTCIGFRQSQNSYKSEPYTVRGDFDDHTSSSNPHSGSASESWVSNNFNNYSFSESHNDLTDVGSSDHHTKTSSSSELSDVSADSVSDAHHSKTSSASELSDVSSDSVSDAHHTKYTDSDATTAVGGSTPWANSDLSNDTVTVAGNPVSLGSSTGISSGDLSDSGSIAHTDEDETIGSTWTFQTALTADDFVSTNSIPGFEFAPGDSLQAALYYDSDDSAIYMYEQTGQSRVFEWGENGDFRRGDAGTLIFDGANDWVPTAALESDSVTVAGNSVGLGGSTGISHGDLSDAPSSAHHSKTNSASELSDVSADSVSDAHHSKTSSASELSDVSSDSVSDAHHSRYSDSEARSAVEAGDVNHVSFANIETVSDGQLGRDNSQGFIGAWGGNNMAVLWDSHNVNAGNAIDVTGGVGDESDPSIAVSESSINHNNLTNSSQSDAHHSKTSSASELSDVSADGVSDAHHSKTSSASELSDVSSDSVSDAHHTKTTSASDLTDVSPDSDSDAHHSKYTDSEAQSAVDGANVDIAGDADSVDGYDIQKNGTDGTGVINFKT